MNLKNIALFIYRAYTAFQVFHKVAAEFLPGFKETLKALGEAIGLFVTYCSVESQVFAHAYTDNLSATLEEQEPLEQEITLAVEKAVDATQKAVTAFIVFLGIIKGYLLTLPGTTTHHVQQVFLRVQSFRWATLSFFYYAYLQYLLYRKTLANIIKLVYGVV